ncbi:hypothetical protein AB0T83_16605 [Fluviibacterium sp. DFM31]|uniref:DUF2335 domain-containing protein n=1 Tax=Meridianimarinicoccus marinus TaxID=3231483 RepID=A0ABV3LA06_9RHOB
MAKKTQTDQEFSALANRMGEKLDVPGHDLTTVVGRAGRMLPRRLRREADYLIQMEMISGHPKLCHMVDPARVAKAEARLRAHVRHMNPEKERRDRLLGQIAGYVFGMLVFVALLITVLAWRGVLGPQ